mgnify:CR=1 FL=1|tara:strand:- start:400 stop:840 length:441 start_codon:yes stop_codon:yes gene_type:complete
MDWILGQEILVEEEDVENLVPERRPWGLLKMLPLLHGDVTVVISVAVTICGILVNIRGYEGSDGSYMIGTEHDIPGRIIWLRATFIWKATLECRDCDVEVWAQILRVARNVLKSCTNEYGEYIGEAEGQRNLLLLGYETGSVLIVP